MKAVDTILKENKRKQKKVEAEEVRKTIHKLEMKRRRKRKKQKRK